MLGDAAARLLIQDYLLEPACKTTGTALFSYSDNRASEQLQWPIPRTRTWPTRALARAAVLSELQQESLYAYHCMLVYILLQGCISNLFIVGRQCSCSAVLLMADSTEGFGYRLSCFTMHQRGTTAIRANQTTLRLKMHRQQKLAVDLHILRLKPNNALVAKMYSSIPTKISLI